MEIVLSAGTNYKGCGMSAGLSRGLIAYCNGRDITQEGMGIGAMAARTEGFTLFARDYNVNCTDKFHITKHFTISEQLSWSVMGKPSSLFTRAGEIITRFYMKSVLLQKTLLNLEFISKMRKLLRAQSYFITRPASAKGFFEYRIKDKQVQVRCTLEAEKNYLPTIYVMNEFCGDLFDSGQKNGTMLKPPSGWQKIAPPDQDLWLINKERKIAFRVTGFRSVPHFPVNMFWGREKTEDISWAGFEYEIRLAGLKIRKIQFEYNVLLKEN